MREAAIMSVLFTFMTAELKHRLLEYLNFELGH